MPPWLLCGGKKFHTLGGAAKGPISQRGKRAPMGLPPYSADNPLYTLDFLETGSGDVHTFYAEFRIADHEHAFAFKHSADSQKGHTSHKRKRFKL